MAENYPQVFLNYISFVIFNILICFYHFLYIRVFCIFEPKNQVIACIFFVTLHDTERHLKDADLLYKVTTGIN